MSNVGSNQLRTTNYLFNLFSSSWYFIWTCQPFSCSTCSILQLSSNWILDARFDERLKFIVLRQVDVILTLCYAAFLMIIGLSELWEVIGEFDTFRVDLLNKSRWSLFIIFSCVVTGSRCSLITTALNFWEMLSSAVLNTPNVFGDWVIQLIVESGISLLLQTARNLFSNRRRRGRAKILEPTATRPCQNSRTSDMICRSCSRTVVICRVSEQVSLLRTIWVVQ